MHGTALRLVFAFLAAQSLACGESFISRTLPPLLAVNTEVLEFGRIPTGGLVSRKVTLINTGGAPLTVARVSVRPAATPFSIVTPRDGSTIAIAGEVEVEVSFMPDQIQAYAAEMVIESNAENKPEALVALRGEGVSNTTCAACDMPPAPACLTESHAVIYEAMGTCVDGRCRYTATTRACAMGCDAETGLCRGEPCPPSVCPDAGPPDGGAPGDAGVADASPAGDAGVAMDAAPADASPADGGAPDADASMPGACGAPAGVEKWSYPATGGLGALFSSPAVANDGTIYAGTGDGRLVALDASGMLRFEYNTGTGQLIAGAPALGDSAVYFGSYDDAIYAVDASTGGFLWSYPTLGDVTSSPAIGADGTIYAGSADGFLYALDPQGGLRWSFDAGSYIYSSPAVGSDGVLYFGTKFPGRLIAVNPTGSLRWSFSIGPDVDSSPALGTDGTIYVGSDDGNLYAVDPQGAMRWTASTGGSSFNGVDSSPAIGVDGTIYVGSWNDVVVAVSPLGSVLWSYPTGSTVGWSSPTIGADDTIYIGTKDAHARGAPNRLIALARDGSLRWDLVTPNFVDTSPALVADGTLYYGGWDGKMHAVCTNSPGLAPSIWPKFRRDARNTGRLPACGIDIAVQCSPPSGFAAAYTITVRDADPGVVTFQDPDLGTLTNFCTTGVGPLNVNAPSGTITASYVVGACASRAYAANNACMGARAYSCP